MKKIMLITILLLVLTGCSQTITLPRDRLITSSQEKVTEQQNNTSRLEEKKQNDQVFKDNGTMEQWNNASSSPNVTIQQSNDVTSSSPVVPFPEPEFKNPIILMVNDEGYKMEYRDNMGVYDLMQSLATSSQKPFIFSTKEYPGMGKFVDEINGIKNDNQKGLYWIYYVNGEPAKIGISNYIIHQGDTIEWKYENSKF